MSETSSEREPEQQEIAENQEKLDAEAEGDGLAAEADAAEGTGISQG
ncbi:hypothetical protein [Nocardioides dongkuii]|nr:hypothetical protein [Nocardioides dongkuii]